MMSDQQKRFIPISLPALGEEEWLALREPIMSGWVTQGPKVAEFEKAFADYHEVKHAIAVTSCTTGLHLALEVLKIGPGDEVIVPSFTWVSTANAALYCGAKPILVDVDPQSFNLDVQAVLDAVTEQTKAVMAVHLFGLCADIQALRTKLPNHIHIIEDAACAASARSAMGSAGSLGEIAVFSFHPRKSITTGEGGMMTTQDDDLAEQLRVLRNHGASLSELQRHHGAKPYLLPDFNRLGFNYRMTDLQAAMGCVQLGKLKQLTKERHEAAQRYQDELSVLDGIQLPQEPSQGQHAWQSYVLTLNPNQSRMSRNQLMEKLQIDGIATRPGTHAIHMLKYYQERFAYTDEQLPKAQFCDQQSMAIPLHNRMSLDDYRYVIDRLKFHLS